MSMNAAEATESAGRGTWRRRRRRRPFSDINVTPFVDVMLVLLVVFIVTAPSIVTREGVDVKLPDAKGTSTGGTAPTIFTITIDAGGKVYVSGRTLEPADIEAELPTLLKGHESETVSLKADSNARQGTMVKVYAALRAAGITRISFPVAGKN
jgi:biopolymer transport protein TolR